MQTIKIFLGCLMLFLCCALIGECSNADIGKKTLKIILIRHGEKPEQGNNLSCTGFDRSIKLVNVIHIRFGLPDYIYVPAPALGKETKNCRMLQTILPFAIKYNLAINTSYNVDATDDLIKELKGRKGTVFIVWEHTQLADIVKGLGVKVNSLKWKSDDYDSIWIVDIRKGDATLSIEKENIIPANNCSF